MCTDNCKTKLTMEGKQNGKHFHLSNSSSHNLLVCGYSHLSLTSRHAGFSNSAYHYIKALSRQTSSHHILQNGLRTGWLPENIEQVQRSGSPSPFRKFVACPGSLYSVREVCTQLEPIQKNVVRTSLVWWGYDTTIHTHRCLFIVVLRTSNI